MIGPAQADQLLRRAREKLSEALAFGQQPLFIAAWQYLYLVAIGRGVQALARLAGYRRAKLAAVRGSTLQDLPVPDT